MLIEQLFPIIQKVLKKLNSIKMGKKEGKKFKII